MARKSTQTQNGFPDLLKDIKQRIQQAQMRAVLAANAELVHLYWDVGRLLNNQQSRQGWGSAVLDRLASELKSELPEVKGFSRRNLFLMTQFYREYPKAFVQPAVAQTDHSSKLVPESLPSAKVQQVVAQIPWAHNVLLLQRVKNAADRLWYMRQTLANGWSRNVLLMMIQSTAHSRQGKAITNFDRILPSPQSDLVQQTLKDPYLFDFLTLQEPFHERELEISLLHQVERFLLELGQGFAFVGRQKHLEVGDDDFYIDLLFYHLKLRCFVVIDLKKGEFKPEHSGKMNFYLSVVDDQLRHTDDAPSIGLILCQDRNQVVAEYALRGVQKPIGISEYELTRALPANLQSALPTIEQIEAQLSESSGITPSIDDGLPTIPKQRKSRKSSSSHTKNKPQ